MNECMDGRALLAEAIREEKLLQVCFKHARPVCFDEVGCPCCKILNELKTHRWNARRTEELALDEKRRAADRELRRLSSRYTP